MYFWASVSSKWESNYMHMHNLVSRAKWFSSDPTYFWRESHKYGLNDMKTKKNLITKNI